MLSRNDLAQEPQKGIEPLTAGVNPGAFGSTLCALSEGSERGTVPQPPRTDAETAHRTTDERQAVAEVGPQLIRYDLIAPVGVDRSFDAPNDAVAFAVAMLLGDGAIEAVRWGGFEGLVPVLVPVGAFVFPRTDEMKLAAWDSLGSPSLADIHGDVVTALRSIMLTAHNPPDCDQAGFRFQQVQVTGFITLLQRLYGEVPV